MPDPVAYNPSDPVQQSFLAALALGESGSNPSPNVGFGGADLSNAPRDEYGFPQWAGSSTGAGPTHAAGIYQFQPSTWSAIAQQYNLNFANPADQNAGAWYLAEQTYQHATGGDLETALQHGDYASVQSALRNVWTSVGGNASAPQGLAGSLAKGLGADISGASGSGGRTWKQFFADPIGAVKSDTETLLVRGGLILLGAVIVIVALWMLLSHEGYVPSAKEIVATA